MELPIVVVLVEMVQITKVVPLVVEVVLAWRTVAVVVLLDQHLILVVEEAVAALLDMLHIPMAI